MATAVRKPLRVVSVSAFSQQKSVNALVQPWLEEMQEVCKVSQIMLPD